LQAFLDPIADMQNSSEFIGSTGGSSARLQGHSFSAETGSFFVLEKGHAF